MDNSFRNSMFYVFDLIREYLSKVPSENITEDSYSSKDIVLLEQKN